MLNLVCAAPPAKAPVGVEEARVQVRDSEADAAELQALIDAAVGELDGYSGVLGRALVTQTWTLALDAFPTCGGAITLPLPPLRSVESIEYIDADGAAQTLDPDLYVAHLALGLVEPCWGGSWPAARRQRGAVTITFIAGYGAAAAVPQPIRTAILLRVGDLYDNRDGSLESPAIKALLAPFRVPRV